MKYNILTVQKKGLQPKDLKVGDVFRIVDNEFWDGYFIYLGSIQDIKDRVFCLKLETDTVYTLTKDCYVEVCEAEIIIKRESNSGVIYR